MIAIISSAALCPKAKTLSGFPGLADHLGCVHKRIYPVFVNPFPRDHGSQDIGGAPGVDNELPECRRLPPDVVGLVKVDEEQIRRPSLEDAPAVFKPQGPRSPPRWPS